MLLLCTSCPLDDAVLPLLLLITVLLRRPLNLFIFPPQRWLILTQNRQRSEGASSAITTGNAAGTIVRPRKRSESLETKLRQLDQPPSAAAASAAAAVPSEAADAPTVPSKRKLTKADLTNSLAYS